MYIEGTIDDFTDNDQKLGKIINAKPINVLYDTDFILANCSNKNLVQDYLLNTNLRNKESLIIFFKKEFGYDQE